MRDSLSGGALTEVTFLVLLALYTPNHGYGIMKFIEEETEGRLILGAGTLYGAINNLVEKEWIVLANTKDSRKKEYIITDLGKEITISELNRIKKLCKYAENIIEG